MKYKPGYNRNWNKQITWGDKISRSQNSQEYKEKKSINGFVCLGCGKYKTDGYVPHQKYCDKRCQYDSKKKDPLKYKAFTMSSPVVLGKGKAEFFEKLLSDSIHKPCKYCGQLLTLENVSLDHKEPFNKTELRTNKIAKNYFDRKENLQIICKKCNQMKGILSEPDFIKLLEFLNSNPKIKDYVEKKLSQSNIMWTFKRKSK